MSRISRIDSPVLVRPAPVADTSAPARALAGAAGGVASFGEFMQSEAEQIQAANLRARTGEARLAYLRGIDALEEEAKAQPDPVEMRERFTVAEAELRERVIGSVNLPDAVRGDLERALDEAALVSGRRVKDLARQRTAERAEAARAGELDELTRRGATTADPLELAMVRDRIDDIVVRDVEAGVLAADRAMLLRREALTAVDSAQLDKSIEGYAGAVLAGDDPAEAAADLRARGRKLGIDDAETDAMLAQRLAEAVGERVSASDFASAAALIDGGLAGGVIEEGEAAALAEGVREGLAGSAESAILRGLRAIRSGAETDIEARRVGLQEAIDRAAPLVGESRALELTVKLNEATRDSVAQRAEKEKLITEQRARSVWLNREQSNLTEPGVGGYASMEPETVLVPNASGELVPVKIETEQKKDTAREWGYAQIDAAATGLMSDDPEERSEAWQSPIFSTLRAMPITGLYDGERLQPSQAQTMAGFARLVFSVENRIKDDAIVEQIGGAMAAGKATIARLRASGGENGPEGTAFEQWFGVYRNLKAIGQNGESDYWGDDNAVFFDEIDRQYTYNLATRGEFWPSVMAAEDELRRRTSEGYSAFKPTDAQVRRAARKAAGVGWLTAAFNGIANAGVFVGNIAAESSRTTGEVGRGTAAEAGRGGRQFDYFPTGYTDRIKNPGDVEQYMRAMIGVNARNVHEVEAATDQAVAAFKRSHVIVNGWAVNIGSGGAHEAVMRASDSSSGPSQMDRVIEHYFESAGGFEGLGVKLDELVMKPEEPAEAGAGWWAIVERTTGAAVGDPVSGLNRFRIEHLAEMSRARLYRNAVERSRKARQEREKDLARPTDVPFAGTVRRFSLDAARLMSPGGSGPIGRPPTPEQIEEMRRIEERLPRGRDGDAIKRLRERGLSDG